MKRSYVSLAFAVFVACLPASAGPEADGAPKPARSDLVESARVRLAQVDVTVAGPPGASAGLGASDFTLEVGGRTIGGLLVDFVGSTTAAPREAPAAAAPVRPATYVLYFDQRHLTTTGRRRALGIARDLLPRLLLDGGRVTVVSSGRTMETAVSRATDPAAVRTALDRIESDKAQVDETANLEEFHVSQLESDVSQIRADTDAEAAAVSRAMQGLDGAGSGPPGANNEGKRRQNATKHSVIEGGEIELLGLASRLEDDERHLAEGEWERLRGILAGLEGEEPPKVLVYFADTMRRNPGEHFRRLLHKDQKRSTMLDVDQAYLSTNPRREGAQALGPEYAFDAVVNEATAHGVRFYSVQAEGMTASSDRVRDAQDTLASMALDTGGRSFLRGAGSDAIARGIAEDLSSTYVLSFDPAGLPEDRPLPVHVEIHRAGVTAVTRSRMVIQSDAARRASRVLAAFVSGGDSGGEGARVRAEVIPTGYHGGRFEGLVQVSVAPPADEPGAWDLGFSVVSRGNVESSASSRLEVNAPGVPLVLEQEVEFKPGGYRVLAVAQQASFNRVASAAVDGAWPQVKREAVGVGRIVIVQPVAGGFRRGDAMRTNGSLAVSEGDVVQGKFPSAFLGVLCRGEDLRVPLVVQRELRGETAIRFPDIRIEPRGDACAVTRDLVRAGTLGPGDFVYEVRILDGDKELGRGERRFRVAPPIPATTAAPPP
jgi:VWFA-related protein